MGVSETAVLKAERNSRPPPQGFTIEFYVHILCDGSRGGGCSRASFSLAALWKDL